MHLRLFYLLCLTTLFGATLLPAESAAEIQTRHHQSLLKEITAYISENPDAADLGVAYETALQTAFVLDDQEQVIHLLHANLKHLKEKGTVDVRSVAQQAILLGRLAKQNGNRDVLNDTLVIVRELAITHPEGLLSEIATELERMVSQTGIGDRPRLSGQTTDGLKIDLAEYRGKVVLIDFWATWCPPCITELPNLKATYAKYHGQGFEIIGVSADRVLKPLVNLIKQEEIAWPNLFDKAQSPSLQEVFGISAYPTTYLVDQEGKIVAMNLRGEELAREVARLLEKGGQTP